MNLTKQHYHLISLLAHFMLLAIAGLLLKESVLIHPIGEQQVSEIASYLYSGEATPFSGAQKIQHEKVATKSSEKIALADGLTRAFNHHRTEEKNTADKETLQSTLSSSSHGEATEGLLSILHVAIQKKQQYPASAMQMEREGRVGVKFKLMPDGSIQGLQMTKSSGTTSLDSAALKAVAEAAPFSHIEKYVKQPEDYTIDVVFELA